MKDPFSAFYFRAQQERIKNRNNKKKRRGNRNKTTIIPGAYQTKQNINSDPGSADAPSTSTYQSRG